ncbi:ABC transporter permease [Bacillus cytotoxicus]|uniref:Binding-protein-dependent transport systems inner membrane component n=1 Tax=Bacillus cytotoxicus (strain DSM 22905 / CIP 110041 / 391-98 / NVH 391-98) TaxID=315749 RepID=A7GKC8_BACCN|nr:MULTISPECIES: ABC transporter permease [Bacillus cereus group]ABS20586.1 binding-protein-dependent transport systems inner membrane component [Bacillus cytotoxicus NVH 391-98]AWC43333.1 ABC transporter permease [Bacillus cytotoxicus]MDH2865651.1 ABC transporter permease [Bacillus cytotoxicus]MDH2885666.1 ABC transporter permease [Bacillus cytotoxicus]NZD34538.1 ABC transporter permease [Bacillus cytotoxicus]
MKTYIIRRLLQMIPTLFGTSIIIFFLFALLPGDYIDSNPKITPERAAELRELYGLNKPIMERYFHWLGNALQGNFGFSLQYQESVTSLLNKFIWNSFMVAIVALFLIWLIALIVGVFSATKQHSLFDKLVTVGVFAAMSFPSFFIGLFLIKVFAVDFHLLPIGGMIDVGSNSTGFAYVLEVAGHMILPVFILTLLGVGSLTRYFRTSMLEVVRQDYIRTARAKGLKEKAVIYKHALKNAILPAITLLAFELPGLFSGAIIIEQIFNWPGIGSIQLEALNFRDYTVLMGFTMFLSVLTIVSNFLADIVYAVVDPRIRLQ